MVAGILIAPSFQAHFGIDPLDPDTTASVDGTIVALLQVGCLVGALSGNWLAGISFFSFSSPLLLDEDLESSGLMDDTAKRAFLSFSDRYGRKKTILSASLVFSIGGAFQTIGANLGMLYVGRFVAGCKHYDYASRARRKYGDRSGLIPPLSQ